MDEARPPRKKRKQLHQRDTHACCFCRLSRQKCIGHPHMNQQAGKCIPCSDDELPCGPYETIGETREFLKKVAHLHTGSSVRINPRTDSGFTVDDGQPTASEPQSQSAGLLNASFIPQNLAPNIGFQESQLPTIPHASQETVDSSISGNGPASSAFTGSSILQEASFDPLDPFPDLDDIEHLYGQAQSGHTEEEDDSAVLSIFTQHDFLRMIHDHVGSEAQVLQSQELECERAVCKPIQHAIENIKKDQQHIFEQMLTAFDQAQLLGNVSQARWICGRIEGVLEKTRMDRTQCLTETRRKDILLKIRDFHAQHKDVSGADRISYELLQYHTSSESKALSLFEDSIEKSLERKFAETENMNDLIPPLHRLVASGNAALFPKLQKAAASGSIPGRDNIGQTILHVAATKGDTHFLNYLLDLRQSYSNFPSIEDRDEVRRTAVYLAISHGQTSAYHLLISRGASLDVRDFHGNSPLTMASRGNHHDIVEDLILNRKRPVNERPLHYMGGCQPLQAAAEAGCQKAVHILLANGADPSIVKWPGRKTAVHLARDNGHLDVAAYIEARNYHQRNQTLPGPTLPFEQG